jgi:putative DNA primase/helicase
VIGGKWPAIARDVAAQSVKMEANEGLRAMLLADIRRIFQAKNTDRITSDQLVVDLVALEGRPWADYRKGFAINKHQVARLLKHFEIRPEPEALFVENGLRARGYLRSAFDDAFARYLPLQSV